MPNNSSPSDSALAGLQKRLQEAYEELWGTFVDPRDALFDGDGLAWNPLGLEADSCMPFGFGPTSEVQLREIRNQCRLLAMSNEFAINGHENRVSFIVGAGHTYIAAAKKGLAVPPEWVAAVEAVLDDFISTNSWQRRQQEIVLRRDRDGEVFLRLFVALDGTTRVRFIEPGQVATPPDQAANPAAKLGILTDPEDVETVLTYFVDGQPIDASEIQHRKANVDANVRRGLPLFFPVRKNLRRAEKLLRNMSVVAEIQSAIALIRRHHRSNRGAVEQFVAASADVSVGNTLTGQTANFRRYGPGTILDAQADVEYDFPASGLDAGNFVAVVTSRASSDRRPAGDARVHAQLRRLERELLVDDDGRGAGDADVPAVASRAARRRSVDHAARRGQCRRSGASGGRSANRRADCGGTADVGGPRSTARDAAIQNRERRRHSLAADVEPAARARLWAGAGESRRIM